METDAHFLRLFTRTGDAEAFRVIVQRHSAMVHGVALRATEDPALAEEVTQSVFAILARKAASFSHGNIGGWLHNTAFYESRVALKRAARYREILHQYSQQMDPTEPGNDTSWEELRPHLDEALSRLREGDREVVVSHFLEKQCVRDIAEASGTTESASRKRLQRAVLRLRKLLEKQGIRTSSAFASVLVIQQLCTPAASAATLTAAALKAAPSIKSTLLIKHTLYLMSTASHVKVAAVVLVIASIPSIILWKKNAELEDRLAAKTRQPGIAAVERLPRPRIQTKQNGSSSKTLPEKTATPPAAPEDPGNAVFQQMLSALATEKWAHDEAKKNAEKEFKRLVISISGLTDDQKARLRQTVEARHSVMAERFNKSFPGGIGGLFKALQDPASLTKEQKEIFAAMDSRRKNEADEDNPLRHVLTEQQYAEYSATEERRRIGDAENTATDMLKSITKTMDLSDEQKDAIFQQLAQAELTPADLEADLALMASSPGLDPRQAIRDSIIRQHLNPEQLQAYDEGRAEEQKRVADFLKLFGGKAPPAGSDTSDSPK